MKKILTALLATAVMICSIPMASMAEGSTYQFGGDTAIAGQDGSAQGQNGWYYMWSPETSKNGQLDATKIKECVASATGSSFFAWGTGYIVNGNTEGWVPDIFAADDYDAFAKNNWWLQLPDGTCNPAVAGTAPYATAIIGFKAPADGEYTFTMKCEAGENAAGDGNDGVTVSINTAEKTLFSKLTSTTEKETVDATVSAMLKANDMIYFAADPNGNGGNDVAKFAIQGDKTGTYIDNATTFKFGDTAVAGQDGSAQGQNGWYYMWSPETNKAGVMDVSQIKECVASETGSLMFMYGLGFVVDGNKGWVPDIYAADDYDATAGNNWWLQLPDGTCNPAVAGNAPYASSVIGFKAPKSGDYSFDMTCVAGANAEADGNDGLTISIYTASGKLFSKATSTQAKDTIAETVSATLKAGDMIYFIADPNANGANDVANFQVNATLTKETVETTTSTQTTTATTAATTAAQTTLTAVSSTTLTDSTTAVQNPKTGDNPSLLISLCTMTLAGAIILLRSKKKA